MRYSRLVLLIALGFAVPNVAFAVPVLSKVSKGKLSTKLEGTGFKPNSEVQIEVTDPTSNGDVPVGSVTTDGSGNFSTEWGNILSTTAAISIGITVHAKQDTTNVTVKAAKDTSFFGWVLEKLLADAGPLRTDYTTTELADAGFVGNVDLVSVSANARIVNETTTFNPATDTITTIGFFDALAPGPVIGTYRATGTFSHLFDPVTGQPVTGTVVLTDSSDPVGTIVVPEPAAAWLMLAGLFGLVGATAIGRSRRMTPPV